MTPRLTLSRGVLRLRRARGFSSDYMIHQLVADWFGDRDNRGYLYRVTARAPGEAHVLVLSQDPPVTRRPERPWGSTQRIESKPFAPDLAPGQNLDFEITINATRVVTHRNGRKARTDVWDAVFESDRNDPRTPHEVYGDYLARKLAGTAEVLHARITARGQIRARRADRKDPITFIATNVIGTIQVIDPASLMRLMASGIGRSKAFGCGLLCLSRPGTILARTYSVTTPL